MKMMSASIPSQWIVIGYSGDWHLKVWNSMKRYLQGKWNDTGPQLQMRLNRSSQIRLGHVWNVCNIRHYVSSAAATVEHDICARSRSALLPVIGWHGRRGFARRLSIEKTCVIFVVFPVPTSSVFYNAAFFIGDRRQTSCVLVDDVQTAQNKNHRHREDGGDHQWDADTQAPGRIAERLFLSLRTDSAIGLLWQRNNSTLILWW